jgi:uncharacterized membrane protein HdeD (DUF308 family)
MTSTTAGPAAELKSAGWIMIAAGAISIVAGVLAIAYPDITLLVLAIFTGVNLIVLSALSLVDAFRSDPAGGSRALSATVGVLGIIAGLVVLRRPGETLLVLVLAIGIWLVISGLVHFFRTFEELEDRALGMLVAISEIVLGGLLLCLPDLSLKTVAVLAGIGFLLRGALAVYAGLRLRKAGTAASGQLAPAA